MVANQLPTELWQETLDWQPSLEQQQQFQTLYELTLAGNSQFNLTRITEPREFWEKHLWDSLRGTTFLLNPPLPVPHPQCIDIGTGAGFPGIPVAIAQSATKVTLLDSTRKKVTFLETLIAELGIKNATTIVDRAENLGRSLKYRQSYDIALIRAVSSASVCAEYALPLVKVGGLAVLYRGQWTAEETAALEPALSQLGGEIEKIEDFVTPLTVSIRHCLYLRKTAPTPHEFPRGTGIPVQRPL